MALAKGVRLLSRVEIWAVLVGMVLGCGVHQPTAHRPHPVSRVHDLVLDELKRHVPPELAGRLTARSLVTTIHVDTESRFWLYRVSAPSLGHGQVYLVAEDDTTLYKLAGFENIDLPHFLDDLNITLSGDSTWFVVFLIGLTVPSGIVYAAPGLPMFPDSEPATLLREISGQCSGTHSADGVTRIKVAAVVEELSWRQRRSGRCYEFSFDASGHLLNWSFEVIEEG